MPPVSKRTRRYLVTAALVVLLTNPLSWPLRPHIYGMTALIFGILTLVWTETLRTRLSGETMRRCMLAGAFLLFTLFPLRECRYTVFDAHPLVKRWLWYGYYLPNFSVPFLFFLAALCVDRREEDRPLKAARFLWIVPVVLTALCLTNDWHEAVFVVDPAGDGRDAAAHGPVYLIGILWIAAVNLAAFFLLIARCRRSGSRRLWYVPVLAAGPAMALIVWYGINGGSPRFRGLPLFQYQEVYALLYVCVWEACI